MWFLFIVAKMKKQHSIGLRRDGFQFLAQKSGQDKNIFESGKN